MESPAYMYGLANKELQNMFEKLFIIGENPDSCSPHPTWFMFVVELENCSSCRGTKFWHITFIFTLHVI